jgi:catechol 2,3-dioxygenase-like lactoylglutathione lyase family enzyme
MATDVSVGTVKFHLSLNVSNLARSLVFYEVLFGRAPAKSRPDYAKFELDEPALVLSLIPTTPGAGGPLNHIGIRLNDSAALVEVQARLEAAGHSTQREEGVDCCYSRQTKFWITDPDRTLWEIYILHEDIEEHGMGTIDGKQVTATSIRAALDAPLPEASHEPVVWHHVLMQPVPTQIPHADNSIDDVHLEGTFNAKIDAPVLQNFLQEVFRVLKPTGKIHVHSLVGDRPLKGKPALPGPAALVDQVPLEHEVMRAIVDAGFVGASFTKLGATPCFTQDCVEMREMRLTASKPAPAELFPVVRTVLYKGPMSQVVDDQGTIYVRGQRVAVNSQQWNLLSEGPVAEQFAFFDGASVKPAACCG